MITAAQRFEGQVAIITGAATGIGFEVAARLGRKGARILMVDYDGDLVRGASDRLHTAGVDTRLEVGDVGNPDVAERSVSQAIDAWGRIDILVNNAGIAGRVGNLWELPVEEMDSLYRTNLRGVFLFTRHVIPHMMHRDYGRIVNMASVAGKEGNMRMAPYSATKAGVIALTKSVGKELAATGIRVNCVAPASVQTGMIEGLNPDLRRQVAKLIPMGRVGEPREVAALVSWLASSECSFSTGAAFDVSGGRATF